jgi:hypothetical protein
MVGALLIFGGNYYSVWRETRPVKPVPEPS